MWKLLPLLLFVTLGAESSDLHPPQAALEDKFKAMLSNCILDGRWCTTKNGKMTDEYQDKYNIRGATRTGKDLWTIDARIGVLGKSVTIPIPVRLSWAGDTPVITLDKVSVPGFGTYSARVLLFGNSYAGAWSAKDHGGMLHGTIEKTPKNGR
jgi:hypothetical protein